MLPNNDWLVLSALVMILAAGCPAGTPANPATAPQASASAPTASPAAPALSVPSLMVPTPGPSTADTSARTTIHGKVYTALGDPVDGATVTAKVLGSGRYPGGSNSLTVTTQYGSYTLNGTPTGETILVTASKSGLRTREQTIVPLANLEGNPRANRVDFGGDDPSTAL
jgi:hypothetical protein